MAQSELCCKVDFPSKLPEKAAYSSQIHLQIWYLCLFCPDSELQLAPSPSTFIPEYPRIISK